MRWLKALRRMVQVALVVILIVLLLWGLVATLIYQYGQTDRAAAADVIIVLGAGVFADGSPNLAMMRRTVHGAALYKKGLAPYVLCTGGYDTPRHKKTEAEVCMDILRRNDVPASAILAEHISKSTEENAIEARKVMQANNLKTALVVSDNYHLLRAETLFRQQGLTIITSPAQATAGTLAWQWAIYSSLREVAAFVWQFGKGALNLPFTSSPY